MWNSFVSSLVSDKYLAEEICKQSVESVAWFLFTAYSKMWEDRDKVKELLSKKELELEGLESSQPIHIANKMRKHVLERMPRV